MKPAASKAGLKIVEAVNSNQDVNEFRHQSRGLREALKPGFLYFQLRDKGLLGFLRTCFNWVEHRASPRVQRVLRPIKRMIRRAQLLAIDTRTKARYLAGAVRPSQNRLLAIWDFQAAVYAVGDLLTFNVLCACLCYMHKIEKADVCFACDPDNPGQQWYKDHINAYNHHYHLSYYLQVLQMNHRIGSVFLIDNYRDLDQFLADNSHRYVVWPATREYLSKENAWKKNWDFIEDFHRECGFIPHLHCRPVTIDWGTAFMKENVLPDLAVAVHLKTTQYSTERNAQIDAWMEFFKHCEGRYPVKFLLLAGSVREVPPELRSLSNILVTKDYNTTLEQDMCLVECSSMFMGSSSGPSIMVVYSDRPYAIFGFKSPSPERVKPGMDRFAFATNHQRIIWENETFPMILDEFLRMYKVVDVEEWKARCANSNHRESPQLLC
ncbi:MAG: hypothetical protein ACOYXY_06635 [Thermodesulfobacteriota bacterium]